MTYHIFIEAFHDYYLFEITEEDLAKAVEAHNTGASSFSIPGEKMVHLDHFQRMRVFENEKGYTRQQALRAIQSDAGAISMTYWRPEFMNELGRDVTREKLKYGFGEKSKHGGLAPNVTSSSGLGVWELLHPKVCEVSKELFEGRHYKQAAQEALTAVDERVGTMLAHTSAAKKIGKDRMFAAFGDDPQLIRLFPADAADASMMQEGYKFIFAGMMLAMRNPKSHRNFPIEELDAIEMLFFASRLLRKLDEATVVG